MSVRLPSCASLVAPVNGAPCEMGPSRHGQSPSATPFQDEQQWHSPTLRAGPHADTGPYTKDASHASLARYALCARTGSSPNLGGGGQPSYSASCPAVDPSALAPDTPRADYSAHPAPTSPRARRRINPSPPAPYRSSLPPPAVGHATVTSDPGDTVATWPTRHADQTHVPLAPGTSARVVAADFARPHPETDLATPPAVPQNGRDEGQSTHLRAVPFYPGSNYDCAGPRRDPATRSRSDLVNQPKVEAERGHAEAEVGGSDGSSRPSTSVSTTAPHHTDVLCKAEPTTPSPAFVDELADESGTASGSQGEGSIADRPPCAKPKKELKGSKRAEQNRAAQRAFRERKEQKLRNLQELVGRIPELEGQVSSLSSQCASLEADCASHQRERQNFDSERASWDRERRSLFGEIDALRRVLSVEQAAMPHQPAQASSTGPRQFSPPLRDRGEPTSLSASSSMSPREMQSGGETEDGSRRLGSVDTASTALEDDEVAVLQKDVKREAPDDFAQQEADKRSRLAVV